MILISWNFEQSGVQHDTLNKSHLYECEVGRFHESLIMSACYLHTFNKHSVSLCVLHSLSCTVFRINYQLLSMSNDLQNPKGSYMFKYLPILSLYIYIYKVMISYFLAKNISSYQDSHLLFTHISNFVFAHISQIILCSLAIIQIYSILILNSPLLI